MCAVTKMCWVSVQGCAQDRYIKGLHLSYAIFKELVYDSGIRSYYRTQFETEDLSRQGQEAGLSRAANGRNEAHYHISGFILGR